MPHQGHCEAVKGVELAKVTVSICYFCPINCTDI